MPQIKKDYKTKSISIPNETIDQIYSYLAKKIAKGDHQKTGFSAVCAELIEKGLKK